MQLIIISPVGHQNTDTSQLLTLLVINKYQILMCFVIFLPEEFPVFYRKMELFLSQCRLVSSTLQPCAATKYWVQQIADMKSSSPMIFVYVEMFVLRSCFVELTIENPQYKDKPTPECTCMLECTTNNASTHHFKIPLPLALRVSGILRLPLMYHIRCTNLAQQSSLGAHNLIVRNTMAMQVSGLDLLVSYKVFVTRLWNSKTFY